MYILPPEKPGIQGNAREANLHRRAGRTHLPSLLASSMTTALARLLDREKAHRQGKSPGTKSPSAGVIPTIQYTCMRI
jgi:hypothetical protein